MQNKNIQIGLILIHRTKFSLTFCPLRAIFQNPERIQPGSTEKTSKTKETNPEKPITKEDILQQKLDAETKAAAEIKHAESFLNAMSEVNSAYVKAEESFSKTQEKPEEKTKIFKQFNEELETIVTKKRTFTNFVIDGFTFIYEPPIDHKEYEQKVEEANKILKIYNLTIAPQNKNYSFSIEDIKNGEMKLIAKNIKSQKSTPDWMITINQNTVIWDSYDENAETHETNMKAYEEAFNAWKEAPDDTPWVFEYESTSLDGKKSVVTCNLEYLKTIPGFSKKDLTPEIRDDFLKDFRKGTIPVEANLFYRGQREDGVWKDFKPEFQYLFEKKGKSFFWKNNLNFLFQTKIRHETTVDFNEKNEPYVKTQKYSKYDYKSANPLETVESNFDEHGAILTKNIVNDEDNNDVYIEYWPKDENGIQGMKTKKVSNTYKEVITEYYQSPPNTIKYHKEEYKNAPGISIQAHLHDVKNDKNQVIASYFGTAFHVQDTEGKEIVVPNFAIWLKQNPSFKDEPEKGFHEYQKIVGKLLVNADNTPNLRRIYAFMHGMFKYTLTDINSKYGGGFGIVSPFEMAIATQEGLTVSPVAINKSKFRGVCQDYAVYIENVLKTVGIQSVQTMDIPDHADSMIIFKDKKGKFHAMNMASANWNINVDGQKMTEDYNPMDGELPGFASVSDAINAVSTALWHIKNSGKYQLRDGAIVQKPDEQETEEYIVKTEIVKTEAEAEEKLGGPLKEKYKVFKMEKGYMKVMKGQRGEVDIKTNKNGKPIQDGVYRVKIRVPLSQLKIETWDK